MENNFKTPSKKKTLHKDSVKIPASPFLKKIGFGTGVAVYELQRSPISNIVQSPWAIKKLIRRNIRNPELNARLLDEAEILKKLSHPNVVGFRAFVKDSNGGNILAMEECQSCLGDMIENRRDNELPPYSAKLIKQVAKDTSNALNYLHDTALLLHCDIKSYNILIKGDFAVCKLCDFGVCLPLTKNGELDESKAGKDIEYTGTPAWFSPEVLDYPPNITIKADIFAYGLVIWEMIALMPPVDNDFGDSIDESTDSVEVSCSRKRPPLPDNVELGKEYDFILQTYFCCTEDDPKFRPKAATLLQMFEQVDRE
ncbi:unnamed protein product [Brassicogethes aeneus]|uniref:mitogen-activated protein kinase kinase n=1 Tax=Brassicogethes aeneus TaxID=1431903 RepID=A0A9P0B5R0_BRAAE|nr:unnamed protein product [Brassicogethes aeneus]